MWKLSNKFLLWNLRALYGNLYSHDTKQRDSLCTVSTGFFCTPMIRLKLIWRHFLPGNDEKFWLPLWECLWNLEPCLYHSSEVQAGQANPTQGRQVFGILGGRNAAWSRLSCICQPIVASRLIGFEKDWLKRERKPRRSEVSEKDVVCSWTSFGLTNETKHTSWNIPKGFKKPPRSWKLTGLSYEQETCRNVFVFTAFAYISSVPGWGPQPAACVGQT